MKFRHFLPERLSQTILLFGLISALFGGGWLLYVRHALIERRVLTYASVCMAGWRELTYSVLFHFAVAAILALDEKHRKEGKDT